MEVQVKALRPSGNSISSAEKGLGWIGPIIITAYFIFFAITVLPDVEFRRFPDSFRYMWEGDISRFFFLGSSFSLRAMYLLLGNNIESIGYLQFAILYFSALAIYFVIKTQNRYANIIAALLVVLIYDTPEFRGAFYIATPETAFAHLILIFSIVLFCSRKVLLPIVVGFLLAFSRGIGPYIVISQLALYALMFPIAEVKKKLMVLLLPLALIGGSAYYLSQQYDTATQNYIVANVWNRILPFEDKTEFFIENYGLPKGPYLETCKGGDILWYCTDYVGMYSGNHVTRNYSILQDDYGYADWVRAMGPNIWQDYILFKDTANTWHEFSENLPKYFNKPWWRDKHRVFDIDPYKSFRKVIEILGLSGLVPLLSLIGIGFILYFVFDRSRTMRISLVLCCSGLGAVFVGYFGDSAGFERHMWPGYIVLHAGLFIYFWSIPIMLLSKLRPESDLS